MVANLNWLTDVLATGGDLSYNSDIAEQQMLDIISQDISLIIDLRMEANDAALWDEMGMDYLHLPTNDAHGHHIPSDLFDALVAKAIPALEAGGKVLVHCHMGINRGPSGAFAVLLALGWDAIEAYDLIRTNRPQAYIAYAEDALKADQIRLMRTVGEILDDRATEKLRQENLLDRLALKRHIDKVWTQDEQDRVQHIIRSNHQRDTAEWLEARK